MAALTGGPSRSGPMYKHLSPEEGYQIYSLMKAKHTLTQIAHLLGRQRKPLVARSILAVGDVTSVLNSPAIRPKSDPKAVAMPGAYRALGLAPGGVLAGCSVQH